MKLGAFSISLTVADLAPSQRCYEALGFEATGGDADQGRLITNHASTDPDGTGPAHIVVTDPDGNRIVVDRFFDLPGSRTDD